MGNLIEVVGNLPAQQRADKCWKEIQEVLNKYQCRIDPFVKLQPQQNEYGMTIVALPIPGERE